MKNPDEQLEHVLILGGGVAGLATGYEMARRGIRVTVLERQDEVGGLARTLEYEGFRFDIGGHRFHSNNPDVVNWLKDLLKDDLLTVPRLSHIRLGNRFVHYPIEFPNALGIFPPHTAARMLLSYFQAQITRSNKPDVSFEDWVVNRFGRALYDVYFKPYTEKVWGIPCDELSAQWAAKRISIPNLMETIGAALVQNANPAPTAIKQFYYPREGFGMICERLTEEIEAAGGTVITGAAVNYVNPETGWLGYHKDGKAHEIQGTRIVSSLPLTLLMQMLPEETGAAELAKQNQLTYRDLILVYLGLKRDQVSQDSWTYFPSKELIFGRTHEPKNWSRALVPSDEYTSLAVEIFTSRGEEVWEMEDDTIVRRVVEQMDDIGWITQSELYKGWVLRVPFAYPVYYVGYEEKLKTLVDFLSQWDNLHLVGRTGSFQYINSDGVIEDVFRLMNEIYNDAKPTTVRPLKVEEKRWV